MEADLDHDSLARHPAHRYRTARQEGAITPRNARTSCAYVCSAHAKYYRQPPSYIIVESSSPCQSHEVLFACASPPASRPQTRYGIGRSSFSTIHCALYTASSSAAVVLCLQHNTERCRRWWYTQSRGSAFVARSKTQACKLVTLISKYRLMSPGSTIKLRLTICHNQGVAPISKLQWYWRCGECL